MGRAKKALADGNFDEIVPACTEQIESNESDEKRKIEARLLRGTVYLLLGSLADASKDLDYIVDSPDAPIDIKVNALIKRASLNVQSVRVFFHFFSLP